MIYYLKRFIKNFTDNNKKTQTISNYESIKNYNSNAFSYSEFLKNNPNVTKNERREAIQKFLKSTRK